MPTNSASAFFQHNTPESELQESIFGQIDSYIKEIVSANPEANIIYTEKKDIGEYPKVPRKPKKVTKS